MSSNLYFDASSTLTALLLRQASFRVATIARYR